MSIFVKVSTFALRQIVDSACAAVGIKESGEAVVGFLTERFTDHSQRLTKALQDANGNAWKALEIALAGDSLWNRLDRAEDKAFRQQIRAFLDATPLPELAGKATFRQKCLEELRAARKSQALTAGTLDPRQLAQNTAEFARFSDPQSLLDAEWRMVVGLASQVKEAGFPSLAWLLSQRPQEGTPILVAGVRYFFRRAVEDDQKLFQGLSFARLEAMNDAQERGFAALSAALNQQGQRLEELLGDVKAVVVQTHSAVLDLQGQISGQTGQIQEIGQAVMKLLDQHQLQRRELRPADSMSIRNEGERQLVKQLVARYRALPEKDRQLPALLNAVGKLEVVAGEFATAQQDFQKVATLVSDSAAKAEAHFNAYQTALERRDFDAAMKEFIEAVKLDAKRYAPFPVGKYHPKRILGAGGFGTAFLCRHKYMNADVVVKTLHLDDLGRETDKVFTEAQVLRQLDHPAIIRISECGYVDAASKGRPHIIMDYFQGQTLESYVKEQGPLPVEDLLAVAKQVAEGLQAAHGAKILHRDVKPANLLVQKEATGWKVKIIDFGLAMPQKVAETSEKASTAKQKQTMIGSSIAGTLDYGAPEQMGKRKEPVGPYSDVYGWAKTCCYALFQTTQPLMKHWKSVPEPLAELLEKCLDEDPKQRPAGFTDVLKHLAKGERAVAHAPANIQEGALAFETAAVAAPGLTTTRKKPKKSLIPCVLGGVSVLVVASVVMFVVILAGQKKVPGDQAGGKKASSEKTERKDDETGVVTKRQPILDVRNLDELNTNDNEFHTWLSEDGLTIYWAIWPGPNNWIWTARRNNANAVFTNKKRLLRGHSPVVSADGTEMIMGSPDSPKLMMTKRNSVEEEFAKSTVISELIFDEKETPAPRWLSKDSLTLYLEKNGPDTWTSDIWVTTRATKTSPWKTPQPVKVAVDGQMRLSQSFLTNDQRYMFVTVAHEKAPADIRIGVLERDDATKPFTRLKYLDLRDSKGALPNCFMPRYVSATNELFLVSRLLFRSEEQMKQRGQDLWVAKGFVFPIVPRTQGDDPIGEVRQFNGNTGGIYSVDLSSDGSLALSGSGREWKDGNFTDVADNTMRIWEVKTGKLIHSIKHNGYVRQVAFSTDAKQAASCDGFDGTVYLWDVAKGVEIKKLSGHEVMKDKWGNQHGAMGVAFLPNTGNLVSVGVDGAIRIWDTSSGKCVNEFHPDLGDIHSIAVSSDGRKAFCGTVNKSPNLVDLTSGKVERCYQGLNELQHSIALSPDERFLAAGGSRGHAVMWSVADGTKIGEFDGHAVRFSADSKRLLVGCKDFTIRLLDTSGLRELKRFHGHNGNVQGVALTPDGRYALSGGWDGTLRLWRLPSE